MSSLCYAAERGDLQWLTAVLDGEGADITQTDQNGCTPLHRAALAGHECIVSLLLSRGAPVHVLGEHQRTPLMCAAQSPHPNQAIVKMLLQAGAKINQVSPDNTYHTTALHLAAHFGHVHTARTLLDNGADLNIRNAFGKQPLHKACQFGNVETASELLTRGADLEAPGFKGRTPLMAAAECQNDNTDMVNLLVTKGAKINSETEDGTTALHLASQYGTLQTGKALLKSGALVNKKNRDGFTPIFYASQNADISIVSSLAQHGAQLNLSYAGRSLLHVVVEEGKEHVMRMLLAEKADRSIRNEEGCLPVHVAARQSSVGLLTGLLEFGQEHINSLSTKGCTPLMEAVFANKPDNVVVLLKFGADADAVDTQNHAALYHAFKLKHYACAHLLLKEKDPMDYIRENIVDKCCPCCSSKSCKSDCECSASGDDSSSSLTQSSESLCSLEHKSTMTDELPKGVATDTPGNKGSDELHDTARSESTVPEVNVIPWIDEQRFNSLARRSDVYPMQSNPRGLAIIINIRTYPDRRRRRGSRRDVLRLQLLFSQLGYDVKTYTDLKRAHLFAILRSLTQQRSLVDHSAFALCLMGHGVNGQLFMTDNTAVPLDEVFALFSNVVCPQLAGKPKLFIVQTCRGPLFDCGVEVDAGSDGAADYRPRLPERSDSYVAYATSPGYASFRDVEDGSWFISSITDVFSKFAKEKHLDELLTMVTDYVSGREVPELRYKMCPVRETMLRKLWYFFPGK